MSSCTLKALHIVGIFGLCLAALSAQAQETLTQCERTTDSQPVCKKVELPYYLYSRSMKRPFVVGQGGLSLELAPHGFQIPATEDQAAQPLEDLCLKGSTTEAVRGLSATFPAWESGWLFQGNPEGGFQMFQFRPRQSAAPATPSPAPTPTPSSKKSYEERDWQQEQHQRGPNGETEPGAWVPPCDLRPSSLPIPKLI